MRRVSLKDRLYPNLTYSYETDKTAFLLRLGFGWQIFILILRQSLSLLQGLDYYCIAKGPCPMRVSGFSFRQVSLVLSLLVELSLFVALIICFVCRAKMSNSKPPAGR